MSALTVSFPASEKVVRRKSDLSVLSRSFRGLYPGISYQGSRKETGTKSKGRDMELAGRIFWVMSRITSALLAV